MRTKHSGGRTVSIVVALVVLISACAGGGAAADDLSPSLMAEHTIADQTIGVPVQIETSMLFYRTDLLAELGLSVPRTVDELEAAARTITERTDVHGFSGRGRGATATSQFSPYLYSFGAEWNDAEGRPAFDTPAGRAAFAYYGRMLREYGPAGAASNSWQELLPLFQQGRLAMFNDASVFAPQLLDPARSTVAADVGFAPTPSGPGGDTQAFWGWALAMSPFSVAKGPAWYFIQWATGPQVVAELQEQDGVAGARDSIVAFPDSLPARWVEFFTAARADSRSQHPGIVPVPEARDLLGNAITVAIEGGDVDRAVNEAATGFADLVAEDG